MARSIDIQSINFAFGSAAISISQYDKIENIADALQRILRRNPGAHVLIEGHTDVYRVCLGNRWLRRRVPARRRVTLRRFDDFIR